MKRTERQLVNLKQKIADKIGLSPKGPGKRAKRWKAAAAKYETLAMGGPESPPKPPEALR